MSAPTARKTLQTAKDLAHLTQRLVQCVDINGEVVKDAANACQWH